jgi:tetratricopeptide (TPR) repeat protein
MAAKAARKARRQTEAAARSGGPNGNSAKSSTTDPSGTSTRILASANVLWLSLALIAVNLFIYAQVRDHDFVAWDDPAYLSENLRVLPGLTWQGIQWAFNTGDMGNWHPLTWISYMLGVQWFGANAAPHLLTNVLLHILNTLLLFALLCIMTQAVGRSAVVAGLFAAHPLHVESVAWVSERKDVLSIFFGLLAILAYVEYTRRPGWMRYLAVTALFMLGLMAKAMLMTIPVVLLLLDYWPLHRLERDTGFDWIRDRPALIHLAWEKIPLLAVAVLASVVAFLAQQRAGAVGTLTRVPLGFRLENVIVSDAAYIGKMIWPAGLSAFYPLTRLQPASVLLSALILCAITGASLFTFRRYPYFFVGWFWYVITLAPVSGIIQIGSQSMADRYTYLPLIGPFVAVTWGFADLLGRLPNRRILLPAAAAVAIAACAVMARAQVSYWKDSASLWTHALDVNTENDNAQRLLADALSKQGRRKEAIPHYTEALRINPENAEAQNGLGLALADEGKPAEALPHYYEALRLKPALADAHSNLGIVLASQGKYNDAINQYSEALRLNPQLANAHINLGVALATVGKNNEAIDELSQALALKPDNPEAHNNLGILLAGQGKLDQAIAQFTTAVQLKPDYTAARNNLNIALAKQGPGH